MRYLYTADEDELFAYAPGRRDFFRATDDTLWAHESHGWLIAAHSGEPLAHRTGDTYYGAVDGKACYREGPERVDESQGSATSRGTKRPQSRRSVRDVAST